MFDKGKAIFFAAVVTLGAGGDYAVAQSGDAQALARAQHMLRRASAERDTLQADNAKLQAEIAQLKSQLGGLNRKLEATRTASAGALADAKERTDGLQQQLAQLTQALQQTEQEKRQLEQTSAVQARQIDACATSNAKLYQVNLDLLDQYQRKGVWDALRQREPFTGLKQVEVENLVEAYRDKIEDLRVTSKEAAAATER